VNFINIRIAQQQNRYSTFGNYLMYDYAKTMSVLSTKDPHLTHQ